MRLDVDPAPNFGAGLLLVLPFQLGIIPSTFSHRSHLLQQRIGCDCDDHEPAISIWTGEWPTSKPRPSYLGVAILARLDQRKPITLDNVIWRTALSEEEAKAGHELIVGEELRDRMLEIEREGWLTLTDEKRKLLFEMTENEN